MFFITKSLNYFFVMVLSIALIGCSDSKSTSDANQRSPGTSMLSVSSDGHYVISAQFDGRIVLWDLQQHTHKVISKHGNIYSVYYIKNSPYFMWQSLSPYQPKYYTVRVRPTSQDIKKVAAGQEILLTHEGKNYFVYFVDSSTKLHYQRQLIPTTFVNKTVIAPLDWRMEHDGPANKPLLIEDLASQLKVENLAIQLGYQSQSIVHVQDPAGHEVLHFNNFPVYGQVMSADFKTYYAADFNWDLFKGYGSHQTQQMLDNGGFYMGKLLNLSLSDNNKYLLTSGFDSDPGKLVTGKHLLDGNIENHEYGLYSRMKGVVLWNAQTGQPLYKLRGNIFKTYATISPSGRYVVAGDEDSFAFVWEATTGKRIFRLWSIFYGKFIPVKGSIKSHFDSKGLIKPPKGYTAFMFADDKRGNKAFAGGDNVSFKFIDRNHYLRFTYYVPYAILYNVNDPKALKYFPLGLDPVPAVNNDSQDEAMDTSPSKHILVVAMAGNYGGLIEYKYDPSKQTLKKVWVGNLDPILNRKRLERVCARGDAVDSRCINGHLMDGNSQTPHVKIIKLKI